jgi:DNA helicase-2/ATP-dependent DNA helicase PcrA
MKANIPYRIFGGLRFYDRKEILDLLAYMTLAVNPADDQAFTRVVNEPKRGIGATSVDHLANFAAGLGQPMLAAVGAIDVANDINARTRGKLVAFADMVAGFAQQRAYLNVAEMVQQVLEQTGYLAALQAQNNLEAESRVANLEEFITVAQEFDKRYDSGETVSANDPDLAEQPDDRLAAFLSDVALVADIDTADTDDSGQVTMMTLHAAKGLEFPVVFLVGMEEGLFPLSRAVMEDDALEEERRLAYVGITRAKEQLYLTNALSRHLYGKVQHNPVSRFIDEIPADLITYANPTASGVGTTRQAVPFGRPGEGGAYTPVFGGNRRRPATRGQHGAVMGKVVTTGAENQTWAPGVQVRHKTWGTGTVVTVYGTGDDMELDIAFPAPTGIRRLMAAFAPIERVED